MKRNRNPIVKTLESVLIPLGFRRERLSWYSAGEETVRVVNLQKSDWGNQYYVNLAVWILELGVARHPPEHRCHVRVRLSSLVPDSGGLEMALDLENEALPPADRARRIESAMERYATPVILVMRSVREMQAWLESGTAPGVVLSRAARELLRPTPGQPHSAQN
jgi:hypothetical protein